MKVSKPVLYSALLAAVVYAATMLNGGSPPPKTAPKPIAAAKKPTGDIVFLPEDYKAHFAAYAGQPKDAFLPKVVPNTALNKKEKPFGKWMLTGVNTVNGLTSAVLEDDATHEVEILHTGDTLNGFTVVSIEPLTVNFTNKLQQVSHLSFKDPEPPKETTVASTTPAPGAGGFGRGGFPNFGGANFQNGTGFGGGANFQNPGAAGAPTDPTMMNTPTDTTQTPNNGGGGRRGRRNRGGGGN